jgi:hypothetical protein
MPKSSVILNEATALPEYRRRPLPVSAIQIHRDTPFILQRVSPYAYFHLHRVVPHLHYSKLVFI